MGNGVEFDEQVFGHSIDGNGKDGHCWWLREEHIEVVKGIARPELSNSKMVGVITYRE